MTKMTATKRLIKAVEADIDARIKEAKEAGIPALDISMMEKLLRPFAVSLEINRQADTPPSEFASSVTWITAVIMTELVLNMTPKNQPDQVYAMMNSIMNDMAQEVTKILQSTVDQPNKH